MFNSSHKNKVKKEAKKKHSISGLISLLLKAPNLKREYDRLCSLGYIKKDMLDTALVKAKQYKLEGSKACGKAEHIRTVQPTPLRDNSSLANLIDPPHS